MPSKLLLGSAAQAFYGAVKYLRAINTYGRQGVPVSPDLYFHDFGAVLAAAAAGVCASQSLNTGTAGVINGSLASGGVATFATPRNVVAAWTNTAVITVTGTDQYGSIITESSASGTSFTGKKAFKTVTSVTVSANVTGLTVGNGTVLGLPFCVGANGLLSPRGSNAADTGTFVPADTTSPATATTGDVRGTYAPSTTLNGTNRVACLLKCADTTTKVGAYGVKQFGSADAA